MTTIRDDSKKQWTSDGTLSCINAGSLQRIADATELMARNYLQLQAEAAQYKRWYEEECNRRSMLEYKVRALKGAITKLRAKQVRSDANDR